MSEPVTPPPGRKRNFKPWPKKTVNGQKVHDKIKLRTQYLASPHYNWSDFCTSMGYDPDPLKRGLFPVRVWQSEWIYQRTELQDEKLVPRAIDVRREFQAARLEFSPNWRQRAINLRGLTDILMAQWGKKAKQIMDAPTEEGKLVALPFNPMELVMVGRSLQIAQELELKGLLVAKAPDQGQMVPIPERTAEDRASETDAEELQGMPVEIMGHEGIPATKVLEVLSNWYDQLPAQEEPPEEPDAAEPAV